MPNYRRMRILVVGSGGREHALCWKLAQEAEVICAPGNAGIAEVADTINIPTNNFHSLLNLIKEREIDLVVVGPEDPLVAGLADAIREAGVLCFGPGQAAAQLEGSKAFCKAMMLRARVPTADYRVFIDADAAKSYASTKYAEGTKLAIKASGNALGKGVIVAESLQEAEEGIDTLKALGEAGKTLVLEEKLEGKEFSLLTITNGIDIYSLPVAQDYKRIFDGDQGPNTGGMGTFSPVEWVTPEIVAQTERETVLPILKTLREDGIEYRGVLFSGLMQTSSGPKCLEYNVRFGDPETQSVLSRLGRGFADALRACAAGEPIPEIELYEHAAVTVVAASAGYPGEYEKGKPIAIEPTEESVHIFHAGTKLNNGQLESNGGRVLAVTATAPTQQEARTKAYEALKRIHFDGMQARSDIGA
jgi:phosphoribosylamine--glycine ligase